MLDKLKIGILDLLTILVPGGFLVFLLSDKLMAFAVYTWQGYPLTESPWIMAGVGFAVAYVLGHFLFFLGSYLDDLIYEKVRKVYWHEHAKLTAYILMLKEKKTGITERSVLSAWKWGCAWLMANQPAIYAEVERLMAESKFFRSLIIVSIIGIFVFPSATSSQWTTIGLGLFIFLSLVRYLSQRQKSLQAAYHGILTTCGNQLPPQPDPAIFASLKRQHLYVNVGLYQKIQSNNNKPGMIIRLDKFWYGILSFFYSIGLVLIPGFSFLMRGRVARRNARATKEEKERKELAKKVIPPRNRTVVKHQKMEN